MAETEIIDDSAVPARPQVRRRKRHRGRILRIAGLVFIAAALVLAGYLWWNLWGTGFATQRAQEDLRPGFERNVASLTRADAHDRVANVPGDAVAIVGAGPVGLAALLTAQFYSPASIVMIDLDDKRLDVAKAFGATALINSTDGGAVQRVMDLTAGQGVDVAIEAVGVPATFDICQQILAPGGRLANVGVQRHVA